MQLKTKGLIIAAVITLLALIAIQGYLIYNSYELKKKTITIDARNAVAKVYNTKEVDSILWLYRNDFLYHLEEYKSGNLTKDKAVEGLQQKAKEINPGFLNLYKQGIESQIPGINIKFKKLVTSITLTNNDGNSETIISEVTPDTILLVGQNFKQEDAMLINNSTWQKDHEFLNNGVPDKFDLTFKSSIYMNVTDWNTILFKELSGLFIVSSLLLLFVVALLYYSIQNLLKQKRLAEIKTDFINNITHELKTPLSTLSLATKTLTSSYAQDRTIASEAVEVVNRQNIRLQKLIDQVLQSSLGYQEIKLSKEELNGSLFMKQVIEDYRLTLHSEVNIITHIDNTGILLSADNFYLSTAIINLLNNAIKYGGRTLVVSYGIIKEENVHHITVTDDGIGISEKYQKYIFDKFYRVGEKDTHNFKGLGLGLYYTKQIIKAHNGSITVHSRVNHGATFIIKIPIV
ncbi:sensor histidine kinase [Cochleicola gelatinilyticus]|uniref:histidine kinase n=1 Tax=Cochleicola gelatinilyticus TaxID=1763537 RepID=A0A167GVY2_9FLAO|nr:HAMP domain-containing sensor histidine kinase [Cochleicola gelatinilyticus]OAB77959.1 hypothetical protein ULVI_10745 [Cochleicola gelatinilyticus]